MEFYTFLFNLWFNKDTFNGKNIVNIEAVKTTFMNGGYYRVDVSKSVSILALNTLHYNSKNYENNTTTEGVDQF